MEIRNLEVSQKPNLNLNSKHIPEGLKLYVPKDDFEYNIELHKENSKHWFFIKNESFREYQFKTV